MSVNVELTRFRVAEGKEEKAMEWMDFLERNIPACVKTLEDERMYVETIFQEVLDGRMYLYWYTVQGTGGMDVDHSSHEVDKQHCAYWDECIDKDYEPVDLTRRAVMIPHDVMSVIEQKQKRHEQADQARKKNLAVKPR